jgi:hypothetical protein
MSTLLQRITVLSAGDAERRQTWRAARKFALAVHENQVVHIEGQERRILPPGGLSAALQYSDAELVVFLDSLVLAQLSYASFL